MEILRVENLCKSYDQGRKKVIALDNVTLSVNRGEFLAIIGSSGSGKSTLLHLMGGLDKPTSGKVWLEGKDISGLNNDQLAIIRRRKIGFVFQFFNLIPILNVEKNIQLPILMDNKKMDISYYLELIQLLGLSERTRHLPSELSGGEQQRVAIARALINKPTLILADEPTGNLDSKNSLEVINLLKTSVKHYNQTVVMITHNPSIIHKVDRVLELKDGLVHQGGDK